MTKKDLIVMTADVTMEKVVEALLARLKRVYSLKDYKFEVKSHRGKDPGCRTSGVDALMPYESEFEHCLLIFDHQGCGDETTVAEDIEDALEKSLRQRSWAEKCAVVVIAPELETWMWTATEHTAEALGWGRDREKLEGWLLENKWSTADSQKPSNPKEALEAALKKSGKKFSSVIHRDIAERASFKSCESASFVKLRDTITNWFQNPHP